MFYVPIPYPFFKLTPELCLGFGGLLEKVVALVCLYGLISYIGESGLY
jgi:hypothetical protein